jgi:two-component system invasion response regulator UvrY
MYRVLLIDDRALPRVALRELLAATGEIEILGEADSLASATHDLTERAEAIVADYCSLVTGDSGSLARSLVLLNVPPTAPTSEASAAGWLSRDAEPAELLAAIASVSAGTSHISSALATPDGTRQLSRRELEVMRALAVGQTNREIAADLGISIKTIDTHRGHVLKKLGLRNNSDITRFAIRTGFIRP